MQSNLTVQLKRQHRQAAFAPRPNALRRRVDLAGAGHSQLGIIPLEEVFRCNKLSALPKHSERQRRAVMTQRKAGTERAGVQERTSWSARKNELECKKERARVQERTSWCPRKNGLVCEKERAGVRERTGGSHQGFGQTRRALWSWRRQLAPSCPAKGPCRRSR